MDGTLAGISSEKRTAAARTASAIPSASISIPRIEVYDGSLLVSDDFAGGIYRITYGK